MDRAFQMLDARAGREEQTPVFGQAPALGGCFSEVRESLLAIAFELKVLKRFF